MTHDPDGPVLLVGFAGGLLPALATFLPPKSVIFIDGPGVVRRRDLGAVVAGAPMLRDVIGCAYQADGAADAFALEHAALSPSAVIPISDYSVPFAARLAERYGLPGAGYGAACLLRDKQALRLVTAAAGVANPACRAVSRPAEVSEFMAEQPGPIVLKPANRRAAVGTRIVRRPQDVAAAWAQCVDQDEGSFAPDREPPLRMLAERMIHGPEFSVEMLVQAGKPVFSGVTRKFLFDGDRPVELGHVHPAVIDESLRGRLVAGTARVIEAVGMDTGIVHCEWIVEDGEPHLVECGGRMAGDGIVELVQVAWQWDVVQAFFRLMQGRPMPLPPPDPDRWAAVWLPHAPVGRVVSVDGVDAARSAPGVHTCAVSVAAGGEVHELRSSWDRVALVTAEGGSAAEALDRARHAAELIQVSVATS